MHDFHPKGLLGDQGQMCSDENTHSGHINKAVEKGFRPPQNGTPSNTQCGRFSAASEGRIEEVKPGLKKG